MKKNREFIDKCVEHPFSQMIEYFQKVQDAQTILELGLILLEFLSNPTCKVRYQGIVKVGNDNVEIDSNVISDKYPMIIIRKDKTLVFEVALIDGFILKHEGELDYIKKVFKKVLKTISSK